VIVDDHAIMRGGLRMLIELRKGLVVVGEATNRADALALVAREQPDIVLLDLDLHGENSLDFLPELLASAPGARVIVLTGLRDPQMHQCAVRLGALGLVLKEEAIEVLVKAIEKVHAGEVWLDRTMVATVLSQMARPPVAEPADPEAARIALLTVREREIMGVFAYPPSAT